MPPKRGKSGKRAPSAKGWDRAIIEAPVTDDSWRPFVCVCAADGDVSSHFLAALTAEVATGSRPQFHAISATGLQRWAADTAKTKTKAKDPLTVATTEACQLAASYSADEPCPPDLLARLIKIRMLALREAQLAERAAAAARAHELRAGGSASNKGGSAKKKPKSAAKGKKGKGGGGDDGAGKKPSTMVTRANQGVDTVDDGPDNGPDCYVLLEGFCSAAVVSELSGVEVDLATIVRVRAANLLPEHSPHSEADAETVPPEGVENYLDNQQRLQAYEHAVREYTAASPSGSGLRSLCWQDLDVGILGAIDAPDIFTRIATIAYDVVQRQSEHELYKSALTRVDVPDYPRAIDTKCYDATIAAVPIDRCTPALVLDAILTHVERAVDPLCTDSAGEGATVGATSTHIDSDAGVDALLDDMAERATASPAKSSPDEASEHTHLALHTAVAQTDAIGPQVYRYGDTVGQLSMGLGDLVPRGTSETLCTRGRRVSAASRGAAIIKAHCDAMGESGGSDGHGPQRHRLYHASTLSAAETDTVRRARLVEELAGDTSIGAEWTIVEPLARETLEQVLTDALRTGGARRDATDVLRRTKLLALFHAPNDDAGIWHRQKWQASAASLVDFGNYMDHVAPHSDPVPGGVAAGQTPSEGNSQMVNPGSHVVTPCSHDASPVPGTLGYAIGDIMLRVAGTDAWAFPLGREGGAVSLHTHTWTNGVRRQARIIRCGDTQLTLHLAASKAPGSGGADAEVPFAAPAELFVATFSDSTQLAMHVAPPKVPAQTPQEAEDATSPSSDGADTGTTASSAQSADSNPAPDVLATVTTQHGVCVAFLADASVRLTRVVHARDPSVSGGTWGQHGGPSDTAAGIAHVGTRGRYVDVSALTTEASRLCRRDGTCVRRLRGSRTCLEVWLAVQTTCHTPPAAVHCTFPL
eukprot:m.1093328 g.1093328  ORF g.1093328 m.1093328 type:complete len:928 (+) comp24296_c0_seq4:301-3084(+)